MGRPKKNSAIPSARKRLIDAFWHLLETHQLHDITVGMVAGTAHCNRGTFYYHYADIDELLACALQEEFSGEYSLPNEIFLIVSGVNKDFLDDPTINERIARISLVMEKGGSDVVDAYIKTMVVDMWKAVLCFDGAPLAPETRIVIEYAVNGIIGVITYKAKFDRDNTTCDEALARFMRKNSLFLISRISEAQGISRKEVLSRLQTVGSFMNLPKENHPEEGSRDAAPSLRELTEVASPLGSSGVRYTVTQ